MIKKDDKSQQKGNAGGQPAQPPKTAGNPPSGDDLAAKVQKAKAEDERIVKLNKQIVDLTEQIKKLADITARAQAELQNAKIRMEKESSEIRKFAMESALINLLSTIDNFQRAFKHLPDDIRNHEWVKGITAIEQDLMRRVGEMGLKRLEALGQQADTNRHEVLMTGPGEEGKVIEVFEDGYELNGKILRPAKVKVGEGQAVSPAN